MNIMCTYSYIYIYSIYQCLTMINRATPINRSIIGGKFSEADKAELQNCLARIIGKWQLAQEDSNTATPEEQADAAQKKHTSKIDEDAQRSNEEMVFRFLNGGRYQIQRDIWLCLTVGHLCLKNNDRCFA